MRFSIFLCFFLRIRLRRFLISDPMARRTLVGFVKGLFLRSHLWVLAAQSRATHARAAGVDTGPDETDLDRCQRPANDLIGRRIESVDVVSFR